MTEPTLGNPKNTIEILQKYNFSFQKKFGQNFLIDTHVLDKIIASAEITKEDMVLEIGPGIGTMTQYLACAARKVVAVEIDNSLIPILKDTLKDYDNIRIINDDVMKLDLAALAKEENGGKPSEPAILYNDPNYYGIVRKSCSGREHYGHDSKRGGRTYAGRSGNKRVWSFVACSSVLCETVYCG